MFLRFYVYLRFYVIYVFTFIYVLGRLFTFLRLSTFLRLTKISRDSEYLGKPKEYHTVVSIVHRLDIISFGCGS